MTESVFCRTERANLAQSIESSVRNTTNLKMEKALSYGYTLHNRKQQLTHWLIKVKTELEESDRTHVLQSVDNMHEKDKNILRIIRCITALIYIRRQLDKPFVDCKKER